MIKSIKVKKSKPLVDPYSVYPPQRYLTFGYWIYMVPQYKPKSVLILGYGGGTIAGLIKMIWGNLPITGVDIEAKKDHYGVNFIQADAREFVKKCPNFDAVIVDLFNPGNDIPCDFVGDSDFVKDLERISHYLIINSLHSDMSAYGHLRRIGINKPSGSSGQIYYFQLKGKIPNLHPWK